MRSIHQAEIMDWIAGYQGEQYHALLSGLTLTPLDFSINPTMADVTKHNQVIEFIRIKELLNAITSERFNVMHDSGSNTTATALTAISRYCLSALSLPVRTAFLLSASGDVLRMTITYTVNITAFTGAISTPVRFARIASKSHPTTNTDMFYYFLRSGSNRRVLTFRGTMNAPAMFGASLFNTKFFITRRASFGNSGNGRNKNRRITHLRNSTAGTRTKPCGFRTVWFYIKWITTLHTGLCNHSSIISKTWDAGNVALSENGANQ